LLVFDKATCAVNGMWCCSVGCRKTWTCNVC